MKKYLAQAIPLAIEVQDDETLGYAYELWGDVLYMKSQYQDDDSRALYCKKSIEHFRKAGNEHREGEICTWLGERYTARGYYEDALEYCSRSLALNKGWLHQAYTKEEKEYANFLYQQSLADIASLYKAAGDYHTALEYLNQSSVFGVAWNTGWDMAGEKAEIFILLKQYDSSFYYLNKLRKNDPKNVYIQLDLGLAFLLTNQLDSAFAFLRPTLDYFRKRAQSRGNYGGGVHLIQSLLHMGSIFENKGDNAKAISYVREAMGVAIYLGIRPLIMNGYDLLSKIHHHLGNNDSAYQYLLKYTLLKDSIQNRQFIFRLNNYKKIAEDAKKENQIGLLNKDNKIKQQQLKQQATFRNFMITVFIALTFAGLYVYRNLNLKRRNEKLLQEQKEQEWKLKHLESEKKQSELQRQAVELEMQALRAQMNPHFIFNCLSSINRFILKNESKTASGYLTRFSRLIRMVLINSQKPLVSLEEELQMLRLYLDMERLRFKDSFDYSITFLNTIETDNIFIPPLLLQPFCENAIWHGLMHKEEQGRLGIELNVQDKVLICTITDNGIGRESAEEMKSKSAEKEKSMGLKITSERLALLNQEKGVNTFYEIEDLLNENGNASGTKVNLKITYKKSVEELIET
jgi:tetratricopeptide (TPR) repeat protein